LTDHPGADAPADTPILESLGYSDRWRALFAAYVEADPAAATVGLAPARVVRSGRGSAVVAAAHGVVRAKPSSRLRRGRDVAPGHARPDGRLRVQDRTSAAAVGPPACGDWVVLDPAPTHETAVIEAILPRVSAFTRGASDEVSAPQVIAANVDTVFVVHPVEPEPNLRRIERELALAWESGAVPVVVLTKADLAATADAEARAAEARAVALGVDVVVTSAVSGAGLDDVRMYAGRGETVALIGPSGVGKSTLINALLGEERQTTREVRIGDGKGRHTTVTRELVPLPGGGVLLDTPGMRAVVMVDARDGIAAAFADITALAEACRFRDCAHGGEPGCAVAAAVEAGELPADRLASWHKLQREAQVAAMKTDARLRAEEVRRWKIIHKSAKDVYRLKGRDEKR
jgi:ribosome biogenesis GTPase / thiamine phosphate phosphatase